MLDEKTIGEAMQSNEIFVNKVFSLSFVDFVYGEYINMIARFMESRYTMRVSARDHFKSTSFYAHFLQTSFKNPHRDIEGQYFSFKEKMAGYHIAKIKKLKMDNPVFDMCIDKKSNAEAVIKYTWDGGKHFHTLTPHGLLGFKRGIHCDLLYVDDPFQDPASKLQMTIISKINNILKTEILDMVKDGGQLHIAGTPQTKDDFFFDDTLAKSFNRLVLPAIVDEKNKITLWPEWMNWEKLMKKKDERGEKIFNQEYMCSPVYTEEAFFKREQILKIVSDRKPERTNVKYQSKNNIIAGFDVGKKVHPSHLAVFEEVDGKREMIYQKFMDHWTYTKQVEFLYYTIEQLGIDKLYYDATRGELESLLEQGFLHPNMIPINFSAKSKASMATEFERAVEHKKMTLLNHPRLIDQILVVDNDLNAIESPQGHGDSFWSVALAFSDLTEVQPAITFI